MRVLHVASITDNPFNGVCVAVPQHVIHQGEFAKTALLNITNEEIAGIPMQLRYDERMSLEAIWQPFGKPDIIVFHEAYRVPYLRLSRQARKLGIPYVIVPHGELGEWAQRKKRLKKMFANLLLFNRFINEALAIQCLSRSEQKGTHFNCRKLIGTNGIELPKVHKSEFRSTSIKFVYIGRLEVQIKGLDLMMKAFSSQAGLMRKTGSSLSVYGPDLYGRFEEVRTLIAECGIGDFVSLNHEVTAEAKVKVLLDSDVFVQTSRTEGMPMGILEAMSYGLPCLITDGTSLVESLVTYGAGWASRNSVLSISDAIQDVLRDTSLIKSRGASAIELVKNNYEWRIVTLQTLNEYRLLLNNLSLNQRGA